MAYNYNFPVGYQNYYPQYQSINSQQNPQQNNSGLIWVQGEAGAKSYMVAPNNTVALWDSESQTVYLKSADASGMPSMRILDYKIRTDSPQSPILGSNSDFATKSDLITIQNQIDEIRANLSVKEERKYESAVQAIKHRESESE